MDEHTDRAPVEVAADEHLTTSLWKLRATEPGRDAVAVRDGDRFITWSAERFSDEVLATARGLIGLGVGHGDRVAVYAATRVEWTILDYALWSIGAITVPIYDTSSADQIRHIGTDAEVVAIVVGSDEQEAAYREVADELPRCEHAFVLDRDGLAELQRHGAEVEESQVQARADAVGGDDVATIVYTSGTTGPPKGCVLTHHNFVWTVAQTRASLDELLQPGQSTLLFLPLAHIFSRVIQVVCLDTGVVLAFSTGLDQLRDELRSFRPTFLLAVPRVFDKVLTGARQQAHDDGKGAIFDRAIAVAEAHSRGEARGTIGWWTRVQHAVFDRLVFGKLRDAMGGNVTHAISGGAALGERMGHQLRGIGITVLEGYGLTETTAPLAVNRPDAFRIGTVGLPLPGVNVRIDDGEIVVRGGNVFQGYLGKPDETAEVLDDGWFRTEDLGELDDDGFLRITGRAKDLIVTASGKNVAPEPIEDRLQAQPLIGQSVLIGDGRPFVGALIALDPEQLPRWAQEHGRAEASPRQLASDDELLAELQQAVDDANRAVSRAEQVREFRVIPEELSIEGGELTPTMKVKREIVEERYADLIEDIYAGTRRSP